MANFQDQHKRDLFQTHEAKILHYKVLSQDLSLPQKVRLLSSLKLSTLKSKAKTKIQARCIRTGRSHSVYKVMGLSRIALRELGHQGLLLGVSKASW